MSDANRGDAGGAGGGAAGAGGAGAAGAGAAGAAAAGAAGGGDGKIIDAGGAGGAGAGAGAGAAGGEGAAAAGDWPSDWREKMAGGDAKRLAELGRYSSPQAVDDARRAAAERIAKGELKPPKPGEGATPEQVAEWRKSQGIPESPDKYEMPKGLVVGDADKPFVEGFLKTMHDQDATPGEVQRALGWWQQHQEAQRTATLEADQTFKDQNVQALQKEMGADFKRNMTVVGQFLKEAPEGVSETLMGARGPDGRLLAANAKFIGWLTNMALEKTPKMMGDTTSDYWKKGETGAKLQERYRVLTNAKLGVAGQN